MGKNRKETAQQFAVRQIQTELTEAAEDIIIASDLISKLEKNPLALHYVIRLIADNSTICFSSIADVLSTFGNLTELILEKRTRVEENTESET